jgi:squalene-hopene/tetraprenyl-beta-curcumene cyclase
MVPLFILCTRKPVAKNPRKVDIRELFTTPPDQERHYFKSDGWLKKAFLALDHVGRAIDPLIPRMMRNRAMRKAENWMLARLNGEDGLGAIFPAMVNALEAMVILGYAADDPRRVTTAAWRTASPACRRFGIRPWPPSHCRKWAMRRRTMPRYGVWNG